MFNLGYIDNKNKYINVLDKISQDLMELWLTHNIDDFSQFTLIIEPC